MGTKVTVSTLAGRYASIAELNANFAQLADEFDKCVYRDGTVPNVLTASLDVNSQRLLNLVDATTAQEPVTLSQLNSAIAGLTAPTSHTGLTDLTTGDPHTQYLLASSYGGRAVFTSFWTAVGGGPSSNADAYHTHNLGATADHGTLTGLADDDHTQYHNDSRGDTRYQGQIDNNAETLSTGLLTGGVLSVNGGDNTKFDISAGTGIVVDHSTSPPTITEVSFGPFTAQTVTNLATQFNTDIAIDVNGAIVQATSFTRPQLRQYIFLGGLDHNNKTTIDDAFPVTIPVKDVNQGVKELATAIGDINVSGNVYSANGANLNINKTSGSVFSFGRNFQSDVTDPHHLTTPSGTALTFGYVFNDGAGNGKFTTDTTSIDPNNYDDGSGTLASVTPAKWTIQRILFFPNLNKTFVQYGTATYNRETEALDAVPIAQFASLSGIRTAMVRGYIVVQQGETDLTNATFLDANKLGNVASISSGIETTFTSLLDTPSSYAGQTLKAVRVNAGETALEFYTPVLDHGALTGLADDDHAQYHTDARGDARYSLLGHTHTFLSLTDTPASYATHGLKAVRVNAAATALEFIDLSTLYDALGAAATVQSNLNTHTGDSTIHFTVGSISHTAIADIGVNSHATIDTHIADSTKHFTVASIDHTAILNIGSNTHAQIDTHIANGTIHFTVASIDHGSIAGLADDDHTQYWTVAGRNAEVFTVRSAAGTNYTTISHDGSSSQVNIYSTSQWIWNTPMYVYPSTGTANQALVQVDANGNSNGAKVRVRSTSTGSAADAYFDIWGPTKQYSWGMDNSDSDNFVFSYGITLGSNVVYKITSATTFDYVNGVTVSIYDSTNTDRVIFAHDGSYFNITSVNTPAITTTTPIEFNGGVTYDPSSTGAGTDTSATVALAIGSTMRIVGHTTGYIRTLLKWTASGPIEIGHVSTSLITNIDLIPGNNGIVNVKGNAPQLRVYDAGLTDYAAFTHDGTDAYQNHVNTSNLVWQFGGTTQAWLNNLGGMAVSGTGAGFSVADRTTSGSSIFYRTGGTNALWDDTDGDFLSYDDVTKSVYIPHGRFRFPSTSSLSSDVNTMDYYKEGTFTPAFTGATTSPSGYTTQDGYYTRIGDTVHFWLRITMSGAATSGSGALSITGLPFTSYYFAHVGVAYASTWNTNRPDNGYVQAASIIPVTHTATGVATMDAARVVANTDIIMSGSYKTVAA